jgi:gliding motility-associated-like protein
MRVCFSAILLLFFSQMFSQSYYGVEFVENKGQWKEDYAYKSTLGNGVAYFHKNGFTISITHPEDFSRAVERIHGGKGTSSIADPVSGLPGLGNKDNASIEEGISSINQPAELMMRSHAYRVSFLGSSSNAKFLPSKPTGNESNYFIGNDPSYWKTDVKSFGEVVLDELYPGIDIRYYSGNEKIKYDLLLAPGADASKIKLQYAGVNGLRVKNGELIIKTTVGEVKEFKPIAYQIVNGQKREVSCKYVVTGNVLTYELGSYDRNAVLVIDPTLVFSTYTGSKSNNWGYSAAPGPDGSLYAGGIVFGNRYGAIGGYQEVFGGGDIDIAITRFGPNGGTNSKIFSTYFGGSGDEFPHSIIVDPSGNPIVLGRTTSNNFPVFPFSNSRGGGNTDIAVFKLSADGRSLLGSMVIGGSGVDGANIDPGITPSPKSLLYNYGDNARSEVILDASNFVYIASSTSSNNFPLITNGTTLGGDQDGVVLKLTPNLTNVVYATYLGGSQDDAAFVLAKHPVNDQVYVAGATSSSNFPGDHSGTIGANAQGGIDGYVAILDQNGNVVKSSFLGTGATDIIYGIQFDQNKAPLTNYPYVMGISLGNWPVTGIPSGGYSRPGAKQFVSKLQPDLSGYVYSTPFGFSGNAAVPNISPVAFLVDRCENVYVSGWGGRLNLCQTSPFDSKTLGTFGMDIVGTPIQNYTDNKDFYFFVMEKNAQSQLFGSWFGQRGGEGDHVDGGTSRFDTRGAIYQALCANCGGNQICPPRGRTPGDPIRAPMIVWRAAFPTNGALARDGEGGCNLAALKISFDFDGVDAGIKSFIDGVFDTSGCAPLTITFMDTIGIGKTYQWDFGDGTTATTTDPEVNHTYAPTSNTVYTVRLIATDNDRCITTATSEMKVRVGINEALLAAAAERVGDCSSPVFRFRNNSTTALPASSFTATSFVWKFDDGTRTGPVDINFQPQKTFSPGTHKIWLLLNDLSFCNNPDSVEITISVEPEIKINLDVAAKDVCVNTPLNIKNFSVGGVDYAWDFGDGKTATTFGPHNITYFTPGVKTIKLTISENSPNCIRSKDTTFVINARPLPVAAFTPSPQPPQENTPIQFTNQTIGASSYLWEFGDGATAVSRGDTSHLYASTNTWDVYLYATSNFGCKDTAFAKVSSLIRPLWDIPNAFTPNGDGKNDVFLVNAYGVDLMDFRIYNRFGQVIFESANPSFGWDGTYKGVPQPMDAYAYTLVIKFSDGQLVKSSGSITLIR